MRIELALLLLWIGSRAFAGETPGLADHLWATTMEKLAVDQPQYVPYQRALNSNRN